ncbi:hypothetical protein [Zavarzinia compransoris]|uniref:Membrane-anchored protein n=1 Tax=Zavarzinia compransoris TaxID=1264899 RepID=A0A317ECR0_9PROT|nr:hypothetical protein [Zavarzinia compransoris]PWR24056.1 hypothetical protein DKG75_00370 [Zavarzinia compransoris]TDP46387.1 putative membrane-anchored protein [Zavarzinia compransoris]
MTSPFTAPVSSAPNRVPKVTVDFWLIKLMAVTMGETAADYLAVNMGLGLTATSLLMAAVLAVMLLVQFRQQRYVPWSYWSAVVLISVVGTLVTDNLTDNFGVPLETSTILFTVALVATFAVWHAMERSLSIHTIDNVRREAWYWLAILFTFALGTAAGDLVAERFAFGYLTTGILFAGVIGLIAFCYYTFELNGIAAFWLAYIFTRPLGASFGDLLSQPAEYGGLGFGTTLTSLLFLAAIAALVIYMTVTRSTHDKPAPSR